MKSKILVWMVGVLLGVVVLVIARDHIGLPKAKLTIRVVDESGAPVEGAQVTLTFMNTLTRQGSPVEGLTDGNGLFTAEGSSDSRVGAKVEKPRGSGAGNPAVARRGGADAGMGDRLKKSLGILSETPESGMPRSKR